MDNTVYTTQASTQARPGTEQGSTQSPGTNLRKVTVNFAPETYDTLVNIAKVRNITMSEVLRQAIGLMAFYVDETKRGSKFLIERGNEKSELRIL